MPWIMQLIIEGEIWDAHKKSRRTEIAPVVASTLLLHLKMWLNVSVCLVQHWHRCSWLGVRFLSSASVAHWRKESLTAARFWWFVERFMQVWWMVGQWIR
jgi:hypothetical protein